MFYGPELCYYILVILFINVGYHITYGFVGLQVLSHNVNAVVSQYLVDLCQDPWNVVMNMNKTMCVLQCRQSEVWKIHTV